MAVKTCRWRSLRWHRLGVKKKIFERNQISFIWRPGLPQWSAIDWKNGFKCIALQYKEQDLAKCYCSWASKTDLPEPACFALSLRNVCFKAVVATIYRIFILSNSDNIYSAFAKGVVKQLQLSACLVFVCVVRFRYLSFVIYAAGKVGSFLIEGEQSRCLQLHGTIRLCLGCDWEPLLLGWECPGYIPVAPSESVGAEDGESPQVVIFHNCCTTASEDNHCESKGKICCESI